MKYTFELTDPAVKLPGFAPAAGVLLKTSGKLLFKTGSKFHAGVYREFSDDAPSHNAKKGDGFFVTAHDSRIETADVSGYVKMSDIAGVKPASEL